MPDRSVTLAFDGLRSAAGNIKVEDIQGDLEFIRMKTFPGNPDVKFVNFFASSLPFYLFACSADTTLKILSISPNYTFELQKIFQGHHRQRCVWDCASNANLAYSWEEQEASGSTLRSATLLPHCLEC